MYKSYGNIYRLYVPEDLTYDAVIKIDNKSQHYLINVLRLKKHSKIRIFNETCGEYLAELSGDKILKVGNQIREPFNLPYYLCVAVSLIKPHRIHQALDMVTQLGASHIQPLLTRYSSVQKFNSDKAYRCIIEATEQAERLSPPALFDLIKFNDLIKNQTDIIIWGDLTSNISLSTKVCKNLIGKKIVLLIGPEGGFAEEEIKLLKTHPNAIGVKISENILRTETACCNMLSILISYLNKF